jgi:acyl-[acyl-carrier-protein]-phospholipid O-acyltransferase/long-chain-fatty-acid--[acyl-carrier-protein] ligase
MLMSLPAGLLADRVSKRTVILSMKWLELALMVAGTALLVIWPRQPYPLMAVLVLLGAQAALFSPAKYGILPEILPHDRLSSGNGLLEMWSNLGIIAGMVGGGVLHELCGGQAWMAGLPLAILSVMGLAAAYSVPRVPPARRDGGLARTVEIAWTSIRSDRILRLAVYGQVFVWSISSVFPAPILAYVKSDLGMNDSLSGVPMAVLGIGIGVGSVLAGKLSSAKVEYGLIPFGALGLTLWTLILASTGPGRVMTLVLLGLIGISSGIVFVPLNALLQWRAPADRRGAVIALTNVLVYAGMIAGSAAALGLAAAGVSSLGTLLGASVVLAGGFVWSLWLVPDAFLRFILLILAGTLYRVRVIGRSNVPQEGGALLTPNHVSFVDGLFIIASIDRPVRFVVYAPYFEHPILGLVLR